jgi:hypothetical protein
MANLLPPWKFKKVPDKKGPRGGALESHTDVSKGRPESFLRGLIYFIF